MKLKRLVDFTLLAASILTAASVQVLACPMCKATLANADNSEEMAATINTAILILLAPSLALIGALVKLVFKYRHYQNYVNLRPPGAERDSQQCQRDPARDRVHVHSTEEYQGASGFND